VEHVKDLDAFVAGCLRQTRSGGRLVVTTLNRTATSFLTAIVGAEYVVGLVPPGTHDWAKFVRPDELQRACEAVGAVAELELGLHFDPLRTRWLCGGDTHTNYALVVRKP
jgi:2-polyprenyl-6-hydroxyphenyl methylase / 3-demethylubiquinone-9 3-methyltransferase